MRFLWEKEREIRLYNRGKTTIIEYKWAKNVIKRYQHYSKKDGLNHWIIKINNNDLLFNLPLLWAILYHDVYVKFPYAPLSACQSLSHGIHRIFSSLYYDNLMVMTIRVLPCRNDKAIRVNGFGDAILSYILCRFY